MPNVVPPVPQDNEWGDDVVTGWATAVNGQCNNPVMFVSTADPGFANVPNGTWSMWLNSTTNVVKLWVNAGGVMKSVTLT